MKPGTLGLVGCGLAAGLQLLFFLPVVGEGRTLDVALWAGGPPLFRVDGLSLTFGVAWMVALAFAAGTIQSKDRRWAWIGLVPAGLLVSAYAREPVLFYAGWEMAGLGVWLSVSRPKPAKLAAMIHGPGLALLAAIAVGGAGAFAPPEGGAIQEWAPVAVVLLAVAAVGRMLTPALYERLTSDASESRSLLLPVLASTGPFFLAKALVAARWDAWGVWALTLIGTTLLLGVAIATLRGVPLLLPLGMGAIAIIGLGLASASPLAALGAIWLVGLGAFVPLVLALDSNSRYLPWTRAAAVAVSLPGVWLVVQGALETHYTVTAIVILPALILAYDMANRPRGDTPTHKAMLFAALLVMVALAAYPQVAVEWFARPAVGAMAGGVGATGNLGSRWGLGLVSIRPDESLSAALPATGIAVAAFLAWVALYWLRGLLIAITNRSDKHIPPEAQ
ncbi:MAG TPA: hypothetical protein VLQ48_15065 [Chloroflexia bacterium]|nr:hypothetical protein [Chloroflexia bacterium]